MCDVFVPVEICKCNWKVSFSNLRHFTLSPLFPLNHFILLEGNHELWGTRPIRVFPWALCLQMPLLYAEPFGGSLCNISHQDMESIS